ncbi:hypothetical protein HN51_015624 [Arachis hypogaea]
MNLTTTTSCIYQHFFTKRKLHLTLLLTTFLSKLDLELRRYTDSKEAGATALFRDASMGSNNIGVVVNPVHLANLGDFGSPEFVADKLLQTERCKESTKEAKLIAASERSRNGEDKTEERKRIERRNKEMG